MLIVWPKIHQQVSVLNTADIPISALTATRKSEHTKHPIYSEEGCPKSWFQKHPNIPENSSSPWQRQPNKVAFDSQAEESAATVAMPSAFTRAWLLDGAAFRNIPAPAVLCVSVCHLLFRRTDKTGWRGTARVTGQNYAVINPSIRPWCCIQQWAHCPPFQEPVDFSDFLRDEDSCGTCRLRLSGVGICIKSLFRDAFWT